MSCRRCCRRQLSLRALVGDRSWVKRRTCPAGAGAGRTPPIAPELGIERANALHCSAWRAAASCASQPPPPSQPTTQRSRNLRRLAQHQQPSRPPERARPHCAVRRHRSRHPLPRPRPPANDWLGTCVTGLQLPASPRPTSRPHSRREQRSGAHVAVAFAGHPTAVLRPAECTSHSAGRRAR